MSPSAASLHLPFSPFPPAAPPRAFSRTKLLSVLLLASSVSSADWLLSWVPSHWSGDIAGHATTTTTFTRSTPGLLAQPTAPAFRATRPPPSSDRARSGRARLTSALTLPHPRPTQTALSTMANLTPPQSSVPSTMASITLQTQAQMRPPPRPPRSTQKTRTLRTRTTTTIRTGHTQGRPVATPSPTRLMLAAQHPRALSAHGSGSCTRDGHRRLVLWAQLGWRRRFGLGLCAVSGEHWAWIVLLSLMRLSGMTFFFFFLTHLASADLDHPHFLLFFHSMIAKAQC
jgi:hypothetical protein